MGGSVFPDAGLGKVLHERVTEELARQLGFEKGPRGRAERGRKLACARSGMLVGVALDGGQLEALLDAVETGGQGRREDEVRVTVGRPDAILAARAFGPSGDGADGGGPVLDAPGRVGRLREP